VNVTVVILNNDGNQKRLEEGRDFIVDEGRQVWARGRDSLSTRAKK
jgi:hypothetical protein